MRREPVSKGATCTGTPLTPGDLGGTGRARDSPDLVRALGHWGTDTWGDTFRAINRAIN